MIHLAEDKGTAAELAVLLTERGLGGDAPDLAHRLLRFRSDRSHRRRPAMALHPYATERRRDSDHHVRDGDVYAEVVLSCSGGLMLACRASVLWRDVVERIT
jgi:hypothetical protein